MTTMTPRRPGRLRDRFTDYGKCGHCGQPISNYRQYAKHGLAHSYWDTKAGKSMRSKMGKARDSWRRKSRAGLELDGLVDGKGRRTPEHRTRPVLPARPGLKDLAGQERHHRDHRKARDLDGKADRARAKGRDEKADRYQQRADGHRSRHGTPSRADQEAEARERDERDKADRERKEKERAEKGRPARKRGEPRARTAAPERIRTTPADTRPAPSRPAPPGRLAPGATGNGHRPAPADGRKAPERTGRTRT